MSARPADAATADSGSDLYPSQHYAYYVLFLLILIYILNWIDRMVVSILIVPIQQELGVSDAAMGLLSGFSFSLLYAAATIPISLYSDRHNRRNLLTLAVVGWSFATSLCGLVQNFWQLLIGRSIVGVGEAAGGAPAYSLISDYFAPRQRAFALGVYSSGIYLGIMCSLILGSLLAETYGWRATFLMLGPPGIILALLLRFTVKEPLRGRFEPAALRAAQPTRQALDFLIGQRAYLSVVAGLGLVAITLGAYAAWVPTFLIRVHGLTLPQVGLTQGLVLGIFGAVGTFSGGWLSDRIAQHKPRARLSFPAWASFLTAPCLAVFCTAENLYFAFTAYAAATLVSGMHFGPAFGLTQNLARPAMRGLASALVMVATVLTGQGLGPLFTGLLTDALRPVFAGEAIRYSLAIMTTFAILGAAMFGVGTRFVSADIERATGATA